MYRIYRIDFQVICVQLFDFLCSGQSVYSKQNSITIQTLELFLICEYKELCFPLLCSLTFSDSITFFDFLYHFLDLISWLLSEMPRRKHRKRELKAVVTKQSHNKVGNKVLMSIWLEFQWESQWHLHRFSLPTPLEVQLFVHFRFLVHDKPLVSDPLMVQPGWHSVKIKRYKMDCIDFNWILLTGKAIWYPIVNISLKGFLSLLCWSFRNSNISCIILVFEMQQEDWK